MLPDTSDLDSKLSEVYTESMKIDSELSVEQQATDPCSPSDRVMCKEIDDMLMSNGLY